MSEVKHTPGPWKATPIAQGTKDYCIHAKGIPWQLAYLSENSQFEWPIEANARLIAAAPELYAALRPFAGLSFTGSVYDGKSEDTHVLFCHADGSAVTLGDFNRARAALAKVEGN